MVVRTAAAEVSVLQLMFLFMTNMFQLRPYALHADVQDVLSRHPHGRDVPLRKAGAIQAHQIERARPSYVQALVIASRGELRSPQCERCKAGRGPFAECYGLRALREGACANCVWRDYSARCQHRTSNYILSGFAFD